MIYEGEVQFLNLKPIRFVNSKAESKIELGKLIKLWILADRDKLIFLDEMNNPISRLYLSACEVKVSQDKHNVMVSYNQKDQKNHENHKVDIVNIKTSAACIEEIRLLCPQRKYKSCLSFTPSSVRHISILSGESPTQKFRGFINLIGLMFIVLNLRNIVDNFFRYGARFQNRPLQFIPISAIIGFGLFLLFIEFAFFIDRLRFSKILTQSVAKFLLKTNIIAILVYIAFYCRKFLDQNPLSGIFLTAIGLVFFLKLISYMQVNGQIFHILEKAKTLEDEEFNEFVFSTHEISSQNLKILASFKNQWQQLLTQKRLFYFLAAPTLCYQLSYPKSEKIRYVWLAKRIVEFIAISTLQLVIWVQYIEPELSIWASNNQSYSFIQLLNRLLRLSVPNTVAWISGFYNFFHVFLNIVSEIIQFGDRNFYMDWWNCRNLEEYWKTWNLPVHFFFIRHCYTPLLKKGFSKITANFIVFILSAIAHQYLVCVPLGLVSYYAFLAMLLQAPAIFIEKKLSKTFKLENSELGNVSFWLFFCILGQPTCLFIYYYLYMQKLGQA